MAVVSRNHERAIRLWTEGPWASFDRAGVSCPLDAGMGYYRLTFRLGSLEVDAAVSERLLGAPDKTLRRMGAAIADLVAKSFDRAGN